MIWQFPWHELIAVESDWQKLLPLEMSWTKASLIKFF
jgi:hypothetical protein